MDSPNIFRISVIFFPGPKRKYRETHTLNEMKSQLFRLSMLIRVAGDFSFGPDLTF